MKASQTKKTTTRRTTTKRSAECESQAKKEEKKTMKMIEDMAHISYRDMKEFYAEICRTVADMQNKGLEIEVKYGCTKNCFTALLIGRKEKEIK